MKTFRFDGDCYRLSQKAKEDFNPDIAENNGFVWVEGFADGQNYWRWDDPETGETIYGSSQWCETEGMQYTTLPKLYQKLFL